MPKPAFFRNYVSRNFLSRLAGVITRMAALMFASVDRRRLSARPFKWRSHV